MHFLVKTSPILDTSTLRSIKFMHSAYGLPPKLDMTIPLKVWKIQVIFSIKIFLIAIPIPMKLKQLLSQIPSPDGKLQYICQIRTSWGLWVSSGWVWKMFKLGCWTDITNIPVTEGNTEPAKGKDNNGDLCRDDGWKCYKCGGNNLLSDCPWLQHANSSVHGGCGVDGRGVNGHGRVNGDYGGGWNGASVNITCNIRDGNHKPMVAWKYIHPVDENTIFIFLVQPGNYAKIVSALLRESMDFIITPPLPLNIVLIILKQTFLSTNLTTL